jgi:hypothetical protein
VAALRTILAVSLLMLVGSAAAAWRSPARTISTSGVMLRVPSGWHAAVSRTPDCDPERLIVASSEPLRISANGRVASPRRHAVVVLLLEDRQVQDRPSGDLRRPRHFEVAWSDLRTLAPDGYCGNPRGPAAMHYFKTHNRYLGYIVYPGTSVGRHARAQTLTLMDSLQVTS